MCLKRAVVAAQGKNNRRFIDVKDVLSVESYCSISGKLTKKITVKTD